MRLIDADALIYDEMAKDFIVVFKHNIDNAPTVDAVPVKHGEWLETEFSNLRECSCCHVWWVAYDTDYYLYCPKCGARMDADDI